MERYICTSCNGFGEIDNQTCRECRGKMVIPEHGFHDEVRPSINWKKAIDQTLAKFDFDKANKSLQRKK